MGQEMRTTIAATLILFVEYVDVLNSVSLSIETWNCWDRFWKSTPFLQTRVPNIRCLLSLQGVAKLDHVVGQSSIRPLLRTIGCHPWKRRTWNPRRCGFCSCFFFRLWEIFVKFAKVLACRVEQPYFLQQVFFQKAGWRKGLVLYLWNLLGNSQLVGCELRWSEWYSDGNSRWQITGDQTIQKYTKYKHMATLRISLVIVHSALFGFVSYNDPCQRDNDSSLRPFPFISGH